MNLYFRFATVADAMTLASMNAQLIRDTSDRNDMTLPRLEQRMARWLSGEYQAVVFESVPTLILGYALFRREQEFVYLRQLFVGAEFRRRGVGRRALAWLRANAWCGAPPRVRIEVLVDNDAGRAFWRALGFRDYSLTLELDTRG